MTHNTHNPEARATIFKLANADDRRHFEEFNSALDAYEVFDTLEEQLAELLVTRTPSLRSDPVGLVNAVSQALGEGGWAQFGCWA